MKGKNKNPTQMGEDANEYPNDVQAVNKGSSQLHSLDASKMADPWTKVSGTPSQL